MRGHGRRPRSLTMTTTASPGRVPVPVPASVPARFALAIFLGAFLLFQVQFILAKRLLPWFGGAPGVWTACMLFFQVLLLAGYGYAHGLTRWAPRRQRDVHLALLAAALLLLLFRARSGPSPRTPGDAWSPDAGASPVLSILRTLAV